MQGDQPLGNPVGKGRSLDQIPGPVREYHRPGRCRGWPRCWEGVRPDRTCASPGEAVWTAGEGVWRTFRATWRLTSPPYGYCKYQYINALQSGCIARPHIPYHVITHVTRTRTDGGRGSSPTGRNPRRTTGRRRGWPTCALRRSPVGRLRRRLGANEHLALGVVATRPPSAAPPLATRAQCGAGPPRLRRQHRSPQSGRLRGTLDAGHAPVR